MHATEQSRFDVLYQKHLIALKLHGAFGATVVRCSHCHSVRYRLRSCGNRCCPQCQHHTATQWLQRQQAKLLPVDYFMATFTLPSTPYPKNGSCIVSTSGVASLHSKISLDISTAASSPNAISFTTTRARELSPSVTAMQSPSPSTTAHFQSSNSSGASPCTCFQKDCSAYATTASSTATQSASSHWCNSCSASYCLSLTNPNTPRSCVQLARLQCIPARSCQHRTHPDDDRRGCLKR